jgi:tetratricopeptide (TPR) repeat protein
MYSKAEKYINKAIPLCDNSKVYLEKARLFLLLGWIKYDIAAIKREIPLDAKQYFHKAVEEANHIYNLYCLLEAKIGLGWCALAEKDTIEASEWINPIKEYISSGIPVELRAGIQIGSATFAYQQGDLQKAEKIFFEAISFCNKYNEFSWNCRALVGLGAISWHLGKKEEAEGYWKQALRIARKISEVKRDIVKISIELCQANIGATPR